MLCLATSRYVLDLDSGLADNISANAISLAGAQRPPGSATVFVVLRPEKARAREMASTCTEHYGEVVRPSQLRSVVAALLLAVALGFSSCSSSEAGSEVSRVEPPTRRSR